MKIILFVGLILLFLNSAVFAGEPSKKFETYRYPKGVCEEIHRAIGLFLGIADQAWKKKGDFQKMKKEKATKEGTQWSGVAANYATIYQVVCK